MTDQRRAVAYVRLSDDRHGTGAGVQRQLEDVRKLAQMRGWTIVREYVDNDVSAKGSRRRPEFEAMLAAVTAGEADVLVAWAWDRLERNRADTVRIIGVGQERQLTVALVRGSDIDMATASGRLVAYVLASVARNEIDAKSERQKRAELQRAQAGRPPSRRAFGYLTSGEPHPEESPVVRRLFREFLAGATMAGLAKQLNTDGHTTARGKAWSDTTVRVVLTNPRYVAERWHLGERVAVGDWPALVESDVFQAVQAKLTYPGRKLRRPARKYLGSSLYLCHCGSRVRVNYAGDGTRTYACQARAHMQRNADRVDELVRRAVAARLDREDLADLTGPPQRGDGVSALRARSLTLHERLDGATADYAEGNLTGAQLRAVTARLNDELADVDRQLADAGRGSALATLAGAANLGETWLHLPLDRQRAVLADLVDVVILPGKKGRPSNGDAERVSFEWKAAG